MFSSRKKGKIKSGGHYLSILLMPQYNGKSGILKFSIRYTYLLVAFGLIIAVFIYTGSRILYFTKQNEMMNNQIKSLSNINNTQKDLLEEKAREIDELQEKEQAISRQISDFTSKYREMAENYLTSRGSDVLTSRSGEVDERAFINDAAILKSLLDDLNEANGQHSASSIDLGGTEEKLNKYMDSLPTSWPATGRISDSFGYRIHPLRFTWSFHEGIDIAAGYGEEIHASGSGEVIFSGWNSGYGYAVFIDHGHGVTTIYGHASSLLVQKGQYVSKGDVIAKVGSSGSSTGPHLHFEVRVDDAPTDPFKFLDK